MQAIIQGLRYNTETATLIGEDCSQCGKSDFRWFDAGLYRTRNGRYFVAGKGGPLTAFASHWHGSLSYGERIIPMEVDEARLWAEEHLTNAEIETAFAEHIQEA